MWKTGHPKVHAYSTSFTTISDIEYLVWKQSFDSLKVFKTVVNYDISGVKKCKK